MLDPHNLPKFPAEQEPRVRELIRRVIELKDRADGCLHGEGGVVDPVALLAALEEIEFGLGGLLPPVSISMGVTRDGEFVSARIAA